MLHSAEPVPASSIVLTIGIIFLTTLIEFIVNTSPASDEQRERPRDEEHGTPSSLSESAESALSQDQREDDALMHNEPQTPISISSPSPLATLRSKIVWCSSFPSPTTRRYRLFLAAFFLYPTWALLYIHLDLMHTKPYVDPECAKEIRWPGPKWSTITILNIVLFACAVVAFLRALVDVILECYGLGLSYSRRGWVPPWMPCMPVWVVGVVLYGIFKFTSWPVVWVVTRLKAWRSSRGEEGKARGDERMGLVEGMDHMTDEEKSGSERSSSSSYERNKAEREGEKMEDKIA